MIPASKIRELAKEWEAKEEVRRERLRGQFVVWDQTYGERAFSHGFHTALALVREIVERSAEDPLLWATRPPMKTKKNAFVQGRISKRAEILGTLEVGEE